jgi:hypothetical protein
MAQGVVTLQGNISGGPTGTRSLTLTIPLASAVDATQVVTLSSGANTIAPPSGATVLVITGPNATNPTPNPLSSAVLTVKGVSGDTGVAVSSKYPTMLTFDSTPASLVINSSGTAAVELWWA